MAPVRRSSLETQLVLCAPPSARSTPPSIVSVPSRMMSSCVVYRPVKLDGSDGASPSCATTPMAALASRASVRLATVIVLGVRMALSFSTARDSGSYSAVYGSGKSGIGRGKIVPTNRAGDTEKSMAAVAVSPS